MQNICEKCIKSPPAHMFTSPSNGRCVYGVDGDCPIAGPLAARVREITRAAKRLGVDPVRFSEEVAALLHGFKRIPPTDEERAVLMDAENAFIKSLLSVI